MAEKICSLNVICSHWRDSVFSPPFQFVYYIVFRPAIKKKRRMKKYAHRNDVNNNNKQAPSTYLDRILYSKWDTHFQ